MRTSAMFEKAKLASLYSDYYGLQAFKPSELMTKGLATEAIKLATKRVDYFRRHVRPKFDQILQIDVGYLKRTHRKTLVQLGIGCQEKS